MYQIDDYSPEALEAPQLIPSESRSSLTAPSQDSNFSESIENGQMRAIYMVLPLACLCSMGMAATSATTIFAYATLICEDPLNCHGEEKDRYAGIIAASVTITNFCAILMLGFLQFLPRKSPKAALHLWLSCRAASVIVLALGVSQHSIWIAVCGRVFEGCATDNILQLALNSIYVHAPHQEEIPRIFGISLALYMFGQALSPTIAGIFANYTMSFLLAVGIFVFCAIYLFALVPLEDARESTVKSPDEDEEVATDTKASHRHILSRACLALVKSFSHPLRIFLATPILWGPGLALFSYLAAISYIYPALMVFSTMRFKFTGKENGWLISTAAISSSLYLLIVLFVLPRLFPQKDEMKRKLSREGAAFGSNYWSSLASMSLIALVIPTVGSSSRSWQLFLIVGTASMGLSTPAFLKSYAVALVKDSTEALTALALMETCGALLSPAILGTIQSRFREDLVFIVSAGMIAAAMLLLTVGAFYYALPLSLPRMGRGNRFN